MAVLMCKVLVRLFMMVQDVICRFQSPLTKKYNLDSVKWLMSGAAPLSAELTEQLTKVIPQCAIGQGYGMKMCSN